MLANAFDQINGIAEAARMLFKHFPHAGRRIASQRHDVLHARLPVILGNRQHLVLGRANTGQMPGRSQVRLLGDTPDRVMGSFPGGAPGAVGNRYEVWRHRFETFDRLP